MNIYLERIKNDIDNPFHTFRKFIDSTAQTFKGTGIKSDKKEFKK